MLSKSEWGPKLWEFLHACSFAFPDEPSPEQSQAFEKLLEALKVLLPCPMCREHYNDFLSNNPPPASCGTDLQAWLVDFHNQVNERLGKPKLGLTEAKLKHATATQNSKGISAWVIVLIILGSLLVLGLVFYFMRRRYLAGKISSALPG